MDGQSKRKLKEIIRGLIGDGFAGTQSDLSRNLKSRGFRVTQSTISRTMNQMGVVKETANGKHTYKLKNELPTLYRGSLADLVLEISNNESLIVIKTRPGSAMFVAGFLDHECKASILGTIAGDDTVFVAPTKITKINLVLKEVTGRLVN